MSCNFYLFLDGDSFPNHAWLDILATVGVRWVKEERDDQSPFDAEWECGAEKKTVWVTLRKLTAANRLTLAPAWARWCITMDFHGVFDEFFDAIWLISLGLRWLPVRAPGVRVGAIDGQDPMLVLHETVDAWAENAVHWMLRESVDALVGLVEEVGWAHSEPSP